MLAVLAEGLLPGLVSSHLGLYKIMVVILVDIAVINYFSAKLRIGTTKFSRTKTAFMLLLVLTALLFNSLLKADLVLNLFILFFAGLIFYYLSKTILLEKN